MNARMKKKEKEIAPRFVYSFNHENDNHGCGLKNGEEPACKELYFLYDELVKLGVGGEYIQSGCWSSPPATGEVRYVITRIERDAVYGICTKNTVRVLDACELE